MSASHPWHSLSSDEAARLLGGAPERGLDEAEVCRRRARWGRNSLPAAPGRPSWRLFLDQLANLLTLVLLAAALLAGAIGDLSDMAVILAVVLLNALLGFRQERQAQDILAALRRLLHPQTRVRRDGAECRLPHDALVPGDVVLLESGDRVPADGRLLAAHRLEIDESTLTGESLPVAKTATELFTADTPLGERRNLAFMNSAVLRGRGELLVTETGGATEMGRLAAALEEETQPETPLQRRLDRLGKRLAALAGLVVAVILAMGLLRHEPLVPLVMTAVALAVAAIPEGLPAVVTITLALGMARLTRRGAVVKRLLAVETLGCTSVICTDKTGTLTLNRMAVRRLWLAGRGLRVAGTEGEGIRAENGGPPPDLSPLLTIAVLCNDSRLEQGALVGDPTEGALLALAAGCPGFTPPAWPRLGEIPFEAASRFMATVHELPEGAAERLVCVKGAPGVLVELCGFWRGPGGVEPLTAEGRARLMAAAESLGEGALRLLAFAGGRVPAALLEGLSETGAPSAALFPHLVLEGLAGLEDPLRPGAAEVLRHCREAGIAVKMITGDHAATAAALARQLDLPGRVVTGRELDGLDDAALTAAVEEIGVFARVSPGHKLRVVQALRRRGHVVAMTGDGVNDAPALKAADIGIAMGAGGSDLAREAAAMVLADDNIATILGAVREGRTIYDNIVKFVRFQLSTNIGALLAVFAAPLLGLPLPFDPIQILWVNIIMDGPPAMALSFDPPHPDILARPPRAPEEEILPLRRLGRLTLYGLTMAAGTLGLLAWCLHKGDGAGSWESDPAVRHAQSLAFTTFVLFQLCNAFNARSGRTSLFAAALLTNGRLWLALAGVLALQVAAVHWPPLQALFHTTALTPAEWGLAAAVASSVCLLDEIWKQGMRRWWRGRRKANKT